MDFDFSMVFFGKLRQVIKIDGYFVVSVHALRRWLSVLSLVVSNIDLMLDNTIIDVVSVICRVRMVSHIRLSGSHFSLVLHISHHAD